MESPRIKLLVPQAAERARLKHRLKELRAAADKDKRNRERERKEREKLQRKAEKLAEKASRKKWTFDQKIKKKTYSIPAGKKRIFAAAELRQLFFFI